MDKSLHDGIRCVHFGKRPVDAVGKVPAALTVDNAQRRPQNILYFQERQLKPLLRPGLNKRAFVETRVKPYYLHHPDLAPGTSHFRLSLEEGRALVAGLRGRISGLCQPTYVLDIPGGEGKVPVGPDYVGDGEVTFSCETGVDMTIKCDAVVEAMDMLCMGSMMNWSSLL